MPSFLAKLQICRALLQEHGVENRVRIGLGKNHHGADRIGSKLSVARWGEWERRLPGSLRDETTVGERHRDLQGKALAGVNAKVSPDHLFTDLKLFDKLDSVSLL